MTTKNYIREESVGSFYKMDNGILLTQPMMQSDVEPVEEEWGAVEEDMIGDEVINFRGEEMTFSEAYVIIRSELALI